MKYQQHYTGIGSLFVEICKRRRNRKNEMLSAVNVYEGQDFLMYRLKLQDGQTMSELADKICIQQATMSTMIRRMEANGLVKKVTDPDDKRTSRIYLTAKGRATLELSGKIGLELDEQTVKGLSATERKTLDSLLQKVLKNLE
ncbi:MAG TPA: MarR family transcriptional regulator [Chitinophaga sp.]|uniref:MarR family winged helix-turn-helix transcriptional regulator n=1 Tax=Chitinophaga sp. TaxID=1869181 RepID=UPI002DBD8FFD|nr:MarR family transcriptional regulator [Chitinophaga sp.]HEU4551645.1 MarR family transcriptional regulator [Chitinophaga sp.]